jgi:hypothetical protein
MLIRELLPPVHGMYAKIIIELRLTAVLPIEKEISNVTVLQY